MNVNNNHRARGPRGLWVAAAIALLATLGPASSASWAQQSKTAAQRPAKAAFDLSYVPADAPLVVAVRPADFLKGDDVKSLVDGIPGYDQFLQMIKLKPESITQAIYVMNGADPGAGGDANSPMALALGLVILRVSEAQDWDKLATSVVANWTEAKYTGLTYHKLAEGQGPPVAYYAPDDHNVIVGFEANLFSAMRRGKGKASDYSWIDSWKPVENYDAAVVVDVGWARGRIPVPAPGDAGGKLALAAFSPLWEETSAVSMGLKSDWGVSIVAIGSCGTDDGAKKLANTAQAVLTLCQNGVKAVPALVQEAPEESREKIKKVASYAETAMERARVERESKVVRLGLNAEIKLGDLARLILQAAGAPVPDAAK
jgi:hypothetical protein